MTIEDIADYVGLSKETIARYHKQRSGGLPQPKATLAGRPVWERAKIERWDNERRPRGRLPEDDANGQTISDVIPDLDDWWAKIQNAIYWLRLHNEIHDELIPRILDRSQVDATAARVLHEQFLDRQLMAIRRLAEAPGQRDKPHSLRSLLGQLARHYNLVTRTWFVERVTLGTHDTYEINYAHQMFDQISDQSKPDRLSRRLVHKDIERLGNTSEAVLAFVNDYLAHESARPNSRSPTVGEFKDAEQLLDDLFQKYSPVITGIGETDIAPLTVDWKEPFRTPLWDPHTNWSAIRPNASS